MTVGTSRIGGFAYGEGLVTDFDSLVCIIMALVGSLSLRLVLKSPSPWSSQGLSASGAPKLGSVLYPGPVLLLDAFQLTTLELASRNLTRKGTDSAAT